MLQQKLADMSIQLLKQNTLSENDKKKLSEEIEEKRHRIELLEHQNELLLSQIHSFNIELESIKLKLPKDNNNNNNPTNTFSLQPTSVSGTNTTDTAKEISDLRELLVFTSREKDIIQTDLTTSKQILLRLDQDMKDARQKITMLNEENQHYRERESKSKSDENHAKLLVTVYIIYIIFILRFKRIMK